MGEGLQEIGRNLRIEQSDMDEKGGSCESRGNFGIGLSGIGGSHNETITSWLDQSLCPPPILFVIYTPMMFCCVCVCCFFIYHSHRSPTKKLCHKKVNCATSYNAAEHN